MGHFHWKKAASFPQVQVPCIFDTSAEKREEAAACGLRAHDTLEAFLREDLDAVIIATPNQWHAKYAIAALRSGKNVLCEKPATMTVAEMMEIRKAEKETGRFFTVHQQRRFDADYRVVQKMIRGGLLGQVTTIESRVFGERGVCFGWRADPESGGGMLYDWGVHLIDQILDLYPSEKVCSVYARLISVLTPAVDDYFELTMKMTNGVAARIIVGTFALQKLPRWFVLCDRGTLKVDDFTGLTGGAARIKSDVRGFDSVVGQTGLGPSRTMAPLKPEFLEELPLPVPEDLTGEFWKRFVSALENGEAPLVSSDQVLRQMKVVEAAFQSSRNDEVMKVMI